MRYILDENNYIKAVSFGSEITCDGASCTEYAGSIPSGYSSLGEWASNAVIQAYYISAGELVYDAAKEAEIEATAAEEAEYNEAATRGFVRDNFVSVNAQSLTDTQKEQVRENIGAGTSNFSGDYNDLNNKPTIPTVPVTSVNGKTGAVSLSSGDVKALPNFSLNINHGTAGNPRQVKFLTVDYNTKATYFKMSATSCHDNGTSYQYLEDIIIGVTTSGVVVCNVYKYCQAEVTLDSVTRYYGDVFYVIDTTNKIVDFYILCGQYASSQFTPVTKIGSTTIAYVTQYTGTATYYSSGDKVWANGDGTTYAKLSDIPTDSGGESYITLCDLTDLALEFTSQSSSSSPYYHKLSNKTLIPLGTVKSVYSIIKAIRVTMKINTYSTTTHTVVMSDMALTGGMSYNIEVYGEIPQAINNFNFYKCMVNLMSGFVEDSITIHCQTIYSSVPKLTALKIEYMV